MSTDVLMAFCLGFLVYAMLNMVHMHLKRRAFALAGLAPDLMYSPESEKTLELARLAHEVSLKQGRGLLDAHILSMRVARAMLGAEEKEAFYRVLKQETSRGCEVEIHRIVLRGPSAESA